MSSVAQASRNVPESLIRLAEQLTDGFYLATGAGHVVYANRRALRWLGIESADHLAGRTIDELWRDSPTREAEGEATDERILTDPSGGEFRVREHRVPHHDETGDCVGYFGILVREAVEPKREPSNETMAPPPVRLPESADPRRGCLVFDVDPDEGGEIAHASRDLAHLIIRLTRPEDLVAELEGQRVVLFAEVGSPAALKAIAERVVARGRREVDVAFDVGVAIREADEAAEQAIERAARSTYLRKRRLRGRVPAARSGPHRAA